MIACQGCGQHVVKHLLCPTCHEIGRISYFCSQACFAQNWHTHNKIHKLLKSSESYSQQVKRQQISAPASIQNQPEVSQPSDVTESIEFVPTEPDFSNIPSHHEYALMISNRCSQTHKKGRPADLKRLNSHGSFSESSSNNSLQVDRISITELSHLPMTEDKDVKSIGTRSHSPHYGPVFHLSPSEPSRLKSLRYWLRSRSLSRSAKGREIHDIWPIKDLNRLKIMTCLCLTCFLLVICWVSYRQDSATRQALVPEQSNSPLLSVDSDGLAQLKTSDDVLVQQIKGGKSDGKRRKQPGLSHGDPISQHAVEVTIAKEGDKTGMVIFPVSPATTQPSPGVVSALANTTLSQIIDANDSDKSSSLEHHEFSQEVHGLDPSTFANSSQSIGIARLISLNST